MVAVSEQNPFSFYKEHPKTCDRDDFWGQVKRTVNGKPVSEQQIQMIVDAVCSYLQIQQSDRLLDLCCGNGALTARLIEKLEHGTGVDFSQILIEVAKENFENPPHSQFILDDVLDYVRSERNPDRFTKILCYGSFAYLPDLQARELLKCCFETYKAARLMVIGNCPDKEQMADFFSEGAYVEGVEDEPDSPIGIWRTRDTFLAMAAEAGWEADFATMPNDFYASRYRYDVILSRPA